MIKMPFMMAVATLLLMARPVPAASDTPLRPGAIAEKEATVITSESLIYDGDNLVAIFEGDVRVEDQRIRLSANKMTIRFGEDNSIVHIEAEGEVYIVQEDRQSWSQRATYDIPSGEVVLEGDPLVRRGMDMLQGERITFWRDESRVVCEPNARLTIMSGDAVLEGDFKRGERK